MFHTTNHANRTTMDLLSLSESLGKLKWGNTKTNHIANTIGH